MRERNVLCFLVYLSINNIVICTKQERKNVINLEGKKLVGTDV